MLRASDHNEAVINYSDFPYEDSFIKQAKTGLGEGSAHE